MLPMSSLTQRLNMHRSTKSCLPSLGRVASLTSCSTSMGETKSLSRLTMSLHSSLCSKRQFTSHPSACSKCAWPCKSTTWKFNTRKVPSCTLQMPWVMCRVLWDSHTQDGESWRVQSSWTSETRCFPAVHRWRCWYPGANPCDQTRLAWQERVSPCCLAISWWARSGLKVNDQLVAYATRFSAVRLKNYLWSHHGTLKAKV